MHTDVTADRWKSEQRDWLLRQLHNLMDGWLRQSESSETVFSPDPEVDRIARGRTGGCARELKSLLDSLS